VVDIAVDDGALAVGESFVLVFSFSFMSSIRVFVCSCLCLFVRSLCSFSSLVRSLVVVVIAAIFSGHTAAVDTQCRVACIPLCDL
jgi:hypothetical protein